MTSRTINRSLIIQKDLALGYGQIIQTRGDKSLSEQKIELDFIFREANEIRYLDVIRYTRASLHTNGPLIHYVFDPTSELIDNGNTVLAPLPAIAVGRWIRVTSNSASYNYATVADLIADTVVVDNLAPGQQVAVSGYHMAGDFGGGAFYWDPNSSVAHDGGMVLTPEGRIDPGRWIRIISTSLSVHHFGAVGDNVTDDRAAIENALTAAGTYKLPLIFRDLSYLVTGLDLTITNSIKIIGTGNPLLYAGKQITFTGIDVSIAILGLVSWEQGFNMAPIATSYYNFENVSAVDCGYGIKSLVTTYDIATLRIRGGFFGGTTMRGAYYFAGKVEIADIENVKIQGIGNTGDANETLGLALGVTTMDCETVIIRNCEITTLEADHDIRCHAIKVLGQKIVITNNIIQNINGTGANKNAIVVAGTNCLITDNSITNGGATPDGWIECTGNEFIIADNVLEGETTITGVGMYLAGVGTVSGNRIFGDALTRAITYVGQPASRQLTFVNNVIDCPAATVGIYLIEAFESIITNNHINVLINAIEAGPPVGGETYSVFDTIISNNYFNADVGILFTQAANIRLDHNIFEVGTTDISGTYKNTWWFKNGIMSTTSTKMLDIGDVVNVMIYKQEGLVIWDETLGKPLYAAGATPGDVWVDSAGATVHTPV